MIARRQALLVVAALLWPGSCLAAENPSLAPSIGRMLVAFGAVVALIYGTVWLFRRSLTAKGARSGAAIRPVASFPLGQKARLMVVEVGGRSFLLGVTDHGVSSIAEFDPAELAQGNAGSAPSGFIRHLRRFAHSGDVRESSRA